MNDSKNKQQEGHGDDVFTLIELYYPKEGKLEDVLAIAQETMVSDKPGLIQSQLLRPTSNKGPVSNITVWGSKEEFQTFMKSDEVKALIQSDTMKNIQEWTSDIKVMMFNLVDGWHGSVE